LNHGIDVLNNKLYASSSESAWVWDYDPDTMTAANRRTLVTGMNNTAARTRTLWVSKKNPDYLVVSVGSSEDLDSPSNPPGPDRASVKVFDMRTIPDSGVNYVTGGKLLGYGLRNMVAFTEDRAGILHGADNSVDEAYRMVDGVKTDIESDNPAENLFNMGDPTNPTGFFGGYPYCATVWKPKSFLENFKQGDWFVQQPNSTFNDASCDKIAKKPSAILAAHSAPLDMKFGIGSDHNLYVGLHGKSPTEPHTGYKVITLAGSYSSSGEWSPKAALSSPEFDDVIANVDDTTCTKSGCFHPVGLAFSASGQNLYITSDTSGQIFLVKRSTSPTSDAHTLRGHHVYIIIALSSLLIASML